MKQAKFTRFAGAHLLLCVAAMGAVVYAADIAETKTSGQTVPARRMQAARTALAAGDYWGAVSQLERVVGLEPANADAHALLGYAYRKAPGSDLRTAFTHYRTALAIAPNHVGAHEYVGELYLADRQPERAEFHLAELERICGRSCAHYRELEHAITVYWSRRADE